MTSTNEEKCPQGDCSGEVEYITHLTDLKLELNPATTFYFNNLYFNNLRALRIHKARKSNLRNLLIEECKLK